jgi:hypothetical protein
LILLSYLVGAPRFELGTPSPPDWCANRAALRSDARNALVSKASETFTQAEARHNQDRAGTFGTKVDRFSAASHVENHVVLHGSFHSIDSSESLKRDPRWRRALDAIHDVWWAFENWVDRHRRY